MNTNGSDLLLNSSLYKLFTRYFPESLFLFMVVKNTCMVEKSKQKGQSGAESFIAGSPKHISYNYSSFTSISHQYLYFTKYTPPSSESRVPSQFYKLYQIHIFYWCDIYQGMGLWYMDLSYFTAVFRIKYLWNFEF